jgi:hypothetical protein
MLKTSMLLCHGSVNIVWHLSQAHEYDIQFCIIIHQRWYNQRQGAMMMSMSGNELLHIAQFEMLLLLVPVHLREGISLDANKVGICYRPLDVSSDYSSSSSSNSRSPLFSSMTIPFL